MSRKFLLAIGGLVGATVFCQIAYSAYAVGGSEPVETKTQSAPPPGCEPSRLKIVLDVGHSVEASGVMSARGMTEHEFNLRLSKRINVELNAAGFTDAVVMASNGSGRNGLIARARRINASKPDLLLSIHHDAVQDVYLQEWVVDGHKRYFSDKYSGYSLFISNNNVDFPESQRFAVAIGDELMRKGMKFTTHHAEDIDGERRLLIDKDRGIYRFDQLVVLKLAQVPAVLLEAGVIVNRDEEKELASPERQQLISNAVAAAVSRYCSERRNITHQ